MGVDEDFFELGGDSLLAIKMVSQSRRQGVMIDPSDAVARPTIRGLAMGQGATETDERPEVECLVPIREEGSRPPLVCIHAVNGRILAFRNLAEHLNRDQPVYAFTAVGLNGKKAPLESIEEMASKYVDELKLTQPEGPYRLLGECFGGSICLEMARILEQRGDTVSQIVVIDGALPWEEARAVTLFAKARREFHAGGVTAVAKGLARRLGRKLRQAKDVRYGDVEARYEVFRQKVFETSISAFGSYQPKPVRAPMLLIKADVDDRPAGDAASQPDWAEYTPHLTEAYVDTDHLSMLKEPAVADVAKLVTAHD